MSGPPLDGLTLYVLVVIFAATLTRSAFGFGDALIAVPLLALRLPMTVATPLSALVSVVAASVIIAHDWRRIEFRAAAGLVISALFGIPLGLWVLAHGDNDRIKMLLGTLIAAFAVHSLAARPRAHSAEDRPAWLIGCGFLSGVLGGAYGMSGPPLIVYGASRRWSPQRFRATLQGYFLPVSIAGLIGYAAVGLWDREVTRYFVQSLPVVAAALILGSAINRRLNGARFLRYVHAGLLLIGTGLIAQAALG